MNRRTGMTPCEQLRLAWATQSYAALEGGGDWIEHDLDPAGFAFVEFAVSLDGSDERSTVSEYSGGIDGTGTNEFHQHRQITAVVAVPCLNGQILLHRLTDGKAHHGFRINADDGHGAGFRDGLDHPVQHDVGA